MDYYLGLTEHWGRDETLINVEHDHECSDDLIQALLDCPHPKCTHAYKLYWASTGADEHYAQRASLHGSWIEQDTTWCGYTGIGFCKIAPEVRTRPLEERHWSELDISVTEASDGDWHVHWPEVGHHHQ